jgi:MT0933-like antitoxin protein
MEDKQPSFPEQVRAMLEEYEVERRITEFAQHADQLVREGLAKVGEYAHDHREDVGRMLDRAADAVNGRTEGRHASSVEDVRGILARGVDKLAERRPDDGGSTPVDPDDPASES